MLTLENWETARGKACSQCGKEAFRFLGDLCLLCASEIQRIRQINQLSRKAVRLSYQGKPLPEDLRGLAEILQSNEK